MIIRMAGEGNAAGVLEDGGEFDSNGLLSFL